MRDIVFDMFPGLVALPLPNQPSHPGHHGRGSGGGRKKRRAKLFARCHGRRMRRGR